VSRLDYFHRCDSVIRIDHEFFQPLNGRRKVRNLFPESLGLVVAVAELHPLGAALLAIERSLPPDAQRTLRSVDRDVVVALLVDAPRKVHAPHCTAPGTRG